MIDKSKWFICSALLLFAVIPLVGVSASGGSLAPRWVVKSTYHNPVTGRSTPPLFWEFVVEYQDTETLVSVRDVNGRAGFRAGLLYDRNGCLIRADCFNKMGDRELKVTRSFDAEKPAILEDSLVPGDWLNVPLPWDGNVETFSVTRKVGEVASFVRSIRLSGKRLPVSEAVSRGMVPEATAAGLPSGELLLVVCEKLDGKEEGREILRQLWSSGLPFWLYESTPSRESWFVME